MWLKEVYFICFFFLLVFFKPIERICPDMVTDIEMDRKVLKSSISSQTLS